jgi:hypothetical protein
VRYCRLERFEGCWRMEMMRDELGQGSATGMIAEPARASRCSVCASICEGESNCIYGAVSPGREHKQCFSWGEVRRTMDR